MNDSAITLTFLKWKTPASDNLPQRLLGWHRVACLLPFADPEKPSKAVLRLSLEWHWQATSSHSYFLTCSPFEIDKRELWTLAQMRGQSDVCDISYAWTWFLIYLEVKVGLPKHHPPITKSLNRRISHWKRPKGSSLPGPSQWLRGHGGCEPRSRRNYKDCSFTGHTTCDTDTAQRTSGGAAQSLRYQSTQPRMPFYTIPAQMINYQGKKK